MCVLIIIEFIGIGSIVISISNIQGIHVPPSKLLLGSLLQYLCLGLLFMVLLKFFYLV